MHEQYRQRRLRPNKRREDESPLHQGTSHHGLCKLTRQRNASGRPPRYRLQQPPGACSRPKTCLVSWSRLWSNLWSRCRCVPLGAKLLVSGPANSRRFPSVQPSADADSEFENRLFVESRGSMKAECAAPGTPLAARDRWDVSRDEGRARRRFVGVVAIMRPWRAASADQEPRSA